MELAYGDMQACATAGGWQPSVRNFRRKYFSPRRYVLKCRKSLTGAKTDEITGYPSTQFAVGGSIAFWPVAVFPSVRAFFLAFGRAIVYVHLNTISSRPAKRDKDSK
jgi:hypothetical protein